MDNFYGALKYRFLKDNEWNDETFLGELSL